MKKKTSLIVSIFVFLLLIVGTTTALFVWRSSNTNVNFSILDFGAYINYEKGTDILSSSNQQLNASSTYTGGISTTIKLWKTNSTYQIYGHIYLDVTSIGTNLKASDALKWVIVSGGSVLNQGSFYNINSGSTISLKLNIPLQTTEQSFTIYIWLDETKLTTFDIENEIISTRIKAEATQY